VQKGQDKDAPAATATAAAGRRVPFRQADGPDGGAIGFAYSVYLNTRGVKVAAAATPVACNSSITAAAVPASGLTGSTLAAGVTASSLTSLGTITSLTATTINAFTLGGAIAGAANAINNTGKLGVGYTTSSGGLFSRFYGMEAGVSSASSAGFEINAATGSAANLDMGECRTHICNCL
jgi:hypothetical protein